jgi:hypothetical protein
MVLMIKKMKMKMKIVSIQMNMKESQNLVINKVQIKKITMVKTKKNR